MSRKARRQQRHHFAADPTPGRLCSDAGSSQGFWGAMPWISRTSRTRGSLGCAALSLCALLGFALPWSPAMALRRVLVTGGNKGIGQALCRQLAADHGFHVLLGSRDASRGEQGLRAILEKSPECRLSAAGASSHQHRLVSMGC